MRPAGATIAYVLAKRRVELGLWQTDVAEKCGIGQGAFSKIESGESALTVDRLLRAEKTAIDNKISNAVKSGG